MSEPGVAVVIEDDEDVRNLVDAILKEAGFVVHSAATGREGVEVVRHQQAAIVTLDIGLPDMDGHEVLRRIRQFSDAYVLMLTARQDETETLTAFLTGADDYVRKPFLPRELRARVTAMMRRPRAADAPAFAGRAPGGLHDGGRAGSDEARPDDAVIRHNGLALNYKTRTVSLQGSALNLTRSEFDLLYDLLRGKGEVRTKTDLVRAARGDYYDDDAYISEADERAVETHIGNLRRKLSEDPQSPRFLLTVRGIGYRLAPKRAD
ncbi:response regulator transcription factor [Arthrobacter cupressi]|uniref:DNA-binding response regulator, OmpR family, contains REC and winged-helix (WHTH) domain n=1 Tax=Arthrobacter cupressi TaxID=1045773 RepID=A0A1G8TIT3_9MICC|nr:response regulator transcription factor [Arthrobacter cupressi]NYD79731.1 DNA-binding response OmpR family regulator [Arthrobacter cupressi]SDJ41307.1 DNA-binding response regulator, OmpR family, contains REC and winged-helix (wHTH) domain [Arthrobacter cupressi]